MAYEPTRAAVWIDHRLRSSAVLTNATDDPSPGLGLDMDRVAFRGMADAPVGSTVPDTHILYQLQTPENDFGLVRQGGDRLWAPGIWLIMVVTAGGSLDGTPTAIADEIDNLFHCPPLDTFTGYNIVSSERTRPFMMPSFERGVRYERLGGLYRIRVRVE